ncbi:glycoside hydrolase family 2 TIM barrel-domain containing protein [Sphingobium sp. AP49]|uniref:glycoside hydrolase family 2 TIM barrel-domain containing protein n=1 Tax=Sphingobium sp. AP49 TaxID=1144307 RepID=UPI00026ED0D6|nr:glycoside hydrolase family 2 TIM barrel-domain containing protein [Sphingobium sp. AP49]WHO40932.1 glycoside hydrolase family 2 TIM barrel-domain containing protein [Sphingobium sp. AP49]
MIDSDLQTDRRNVLAMTAGTALVSLGQGKTASAAATSRSAGSVGRAISFDDDWRFHRGEGQGFEALGLDDTTWRRVDLPHDWSVEDIPGGQPPDQLGPFDKHALGGNATGFTVGGEGWYRKRFRVDGYPAEAMIEILFGGAYLETDVWLNGRHIGGNVHGYIPFAFDLTPALDRKGDNVLAVRVRNLGRNTRWYAGSGLYRQVTLNVLPASTRIARWGVAGWTRRIEGGRAEIDITTRIEGARADMDLVTRLRDENGAVIAEAVAPVDAEVSQALVVRGPRLWSPESPALYTLETELRQAGRTIDRTEQPFGIRIVTFDPHRGVAINGTPIKLHGGCIHHDNGLLGARAFADADERRIRLLKARGFNAVRSSHNPSAASLRSVCDRLGMLLIEEAFDVWHESKEPQDFATQFRAHWQDVISAMVLPARNSPSVIMWSIGNEIPSRATDEGVHWAWTLANAVKKLDPTRPVTAGLNGVLGAEMIAEAATARPGMAGKRDNASTIFLDVPGYNYRLEEMQREFARHPERVVYASETFPKNMFDYAELLRHEPSFLGEFVWTAMDYIGEAGIGAQAQLKTGSPPFYIAAWPWANAWCGDLDLLGYQKAQSLARDVAWGLSSLEMAVQRPVSEGMFEWVSAWGWSDELESWSWAGNEGKPLAVRLYSSADRVVLLLNGKPVGERNLAAGDKMCAELQVPYAPGVLEAIAYRGSVEVARRKLETVGGAARLRLLPERHRIDSSRQSLAFVPIEVQDKAGRRLPDDQRRIRLNVIGAAEIIAFGSADPIGTGSLQAPEAQTFRGRAMAILRSQGEPGTVCIEARSEGLPVASTTIKFV